MSEERIHTFITVLGMVSICGDSDGISAVYLPNDNLPVMEEGNNDVIDEAEEELMEYLSGQRKTFEVPLHISGTEFRMQVWERIMKIPYGKTLTYKELAEDIGRPNANRSVGSACGKNCIPIIIPCHRVLASDGIGGYSSGISLKTRLLNLEKSF